MIDLPVAAVEGRKGGGSLQPQEIRRRSAASFARIPSMAASVCAVQAREGLVLDKGGGEGGGGEGARGR